MVPVCLGGKKNFVHLKLVVADETAMTKILSLFFVFLCPKCLVGLWDCFSIDIFVSTIQPLLATSNLVAPSPYQGLEVEQARANARYTS